MPPTLSNLMLFCLPSSNPVSLAFSQQDMSKTVADLTSTDFHGYFGRDPNLLPGIDDVSSVTKKALHTDTQCENQFAK